MSRAVKRLVERGHDADGHEFVIVGANETAVYLPGTGALFVSKVEGVIVVEAVAFNDGEPRAIVVARHRKLMARAKEMFGDRITHHDPLGLCGGKRSVAS